MYSFLEGNPVHSAQAILDKVVRLRLDPVRDDRFGDAVQRAAGLACTKFASASGACLRADSFKTVMKALSFG